MVSITVSGKTFKSNGPLTEDEIDVFIDIKSEENRIKFLKIINKLREEKNVESIK